MGVPSHPPCMRQCSVSIRIVDSGSSQKGSNSDSPAYLLAWLEEVTYISISLFINCLLGLLWKWTEIIYGNIWLGISAIKLYLLSSLLFIILYWKGENFVPVSWDFWGQWSHRSWESLRVPEVAAPGLLLFILRNCWRGAMASRRRHFFKNPSYL